jgi:glycerophosphoryl diester phosphodiesterase
MQIPLPVFSCETTSDFVLNKLNIIGLAAASTAIASLIVLLPNIPIETATKSRVVIERSPIEVQRPNRAMLAVGHRGASKFAPENTLPSIQIAIDLGIRYVELDIRHTSDGVPVLMHDSTIDRTTNGSGRIDAISLAELRELDAGGWFHAQFAGTKVPTLEEALTLMQGKICALWDPKGKPSAAAVKLFKKLGSGRDCVIVGAQGFGGFDDSGTIGLLVELWPEVPLMATMKSPDDLTFIIRTYPQSRAVMASRAQLSNELVDAAHAAGLLVMTTALIQADNERGYQKAMDLGVDLVMIDNIDSYFELLNITADIPDIYRDPMETYSKSKETRRQRKPIESR